MFDQDKFNDFLLKNSVVGFFNEEITLKSGRKCCYYANCRRLTDFTNITKETAGFIMSFANDKYSDFDYIYGVPAGVTKLSVTINLLNQEDVPLIIGREKPKEHGDIKDKYFIGPIKKGQKVIVLEDVTTTGGSLLKEIEKLEKVGVQIIGAIGLIDRQEIRDDSMTITRLLEEKGIKYYSMARASEIIQIIFKNNPPDNEIKNKIIKYFEQYGSVNIKEL